MPLPVQETQQARVASLGQEDGLNEMQPSPGFLPGESHGQRSLAGYSPWGHRELDMIVATWHSTAHALLSSSESRLPDKWRIPPPLSIPLWRTLGTSVGFRPLHYVNSLTSFLLPLHDSSSSSLFLIVGLLSFCFLTQSSFFGNLLPCTGRWSGFLGTKERLD